MISKTMGMISSRPINKRLVIPKLLFVPLAIFAVLSHHIYTDDGLIDLALETSGFLLLFAASMGRVWVSAYISGKKNREIVAEGPYSVVRHPLYFFNFLAYVGAGFACESLAITAGLTILFFATHWPTILMEEQFLRNEFGPQYDAYAERVPRLFPTSWRPNFPDSVVFIPSLFNRAVLDSSLIMLLFAAIQIFEWGQEHQIVPVVFHIP